MRNINSSTNYNKICEQTLTMMYMSKNMETTLRHDNNENKLEQ